VICREDKYDLPSPLLVAFVCPSSDIHPTSPPFP
jgi:hypothetical protein